MTLAPAPLRSAVGLAHGPAAGEARATPECRAVRRQMHGGKPKSKLPTPTPTCSEAEGGIQACPVAISLENARCRAGNRTRRQASGGGVLNLRRDRGVSPRLL